MIINAAIQVVPLVAIHEAIPVIDEVIEYIRQSGINYQVGPFETTLEGPYEQVQDLLRKVTDLCYRQGQMQFLVYIKYHMCGSADVLAEAKTGMFKH